MPGAFVGVHCLDLAGLDLAFVGAIGLFTSIGLPIARGRAATGAGHAFVGAALAANRRLILRHSRASSLPQSRPL